MQIGSQHRSTPFKMKAFAALQQGLIGKIYMSKGLCYKRRPSIGHTADAPTPPGLNWDLFLGPAPMRPFNEKRFKYYWHWFWDTGNGDIGNQGVHEMGIARWGLNDPEWPKTAVSFGGKLGIDDDTETPNTLTAGFNYGDRELVFEVRGNLTGGEGTQAEPRDYRRSGSRTRRTRTGRRGSAGGASGCPGPDLGGTGEQSDQRGGGQSVLRQRRLGSDERSGLPGLQGREQRTHHGRTSGARRRRRRHGLAHGEFPLACRSRNEKELHDPLSNAYLSASLCHLANISYRTGRKLTLEAGPKFTGDSEATKMLTRDVYRKPYVV